jgi:histidinol dehydrogenase
MINTTNTPERSEWAMLALRPMEDNAFLSSTVKNILNRVRIGGDDALLAFTEQFDKVKLSQLELDKDELNEAAKKIPQPLKEAIDKAYENIKKFHAAQTPGDVTVETMPGISCSLKYLPLQTVGLYIPGGTAPLFSSVLMMAIPAQLAGCKNIYLCSPPDKSGNINAAICYAAQKCGIQRIFKAGGAQAIAAMAYGTDSIPRADKIFGPGNQYVTMAKQLINMEGVAIDMPAGPSEVAIFADNSAVPEFIAADLLSQAEHGIDSQVLLVATDKDIIQKSIEALEQQLEQLPRKEIASIALKNSRAIYFKSADEAFDFINEYAPEHLIIAGGNARSLAEKVINAGSVFLGNYTPESAGDYASGTNHTLPTNGTAKSYSGITLLSFMKTITFQEISRDGVKNIASIVETMAEHEQLAAHKLAMQLRRESL